VEWIEFYSLDFDRGTFHVSYSLYGCVEALSMGRKCGSVLAHDKVVGISVITFHS